MFSFIAFCGGLVLFMCAIWMMYDSFMEAMREYKRLIKLGINKLRGIDERGSIY